MQKTFFYINYSTNHKHIIGSLEQCKEAQARLNWDGYEILELVDSAFYELKEKILQEYSSLSDADIWNIYINKDNEDIPF